MESFAVLEPQADGFRNYVKTKYTVSAEEMLVDKAQLLTNSSRNDSSSRWYACIEYQL
jgi:catalase-peroxidase